MLTARINGLYMNDHGKIILFNSKEEIDFFINNFFNYSIKKASTEGTIDPFIIMSLNDIGRDVQIDEWKDVKSCTCGTIKYEDLKP